MNCMACQTESAMLVVNDSGSYAICIGCFDKENQQTIAKSINRWKKKHDDRKICVLVGLPVPKPPK